MWSNGARGVTRGQLPQRAGSLGLNGGGAAAAVPPKQPPKNKENTNYTYAYTHKIVDKHSVQQ